MKYSVILFDLDGTLLESGPAIFASTHEMLRSMGLPDRADEELRGIIGPPLRVGFTEVLHIPEERIPEAIAAYRHFADGCGASSLLRPFAGVLKLLSALKARTVRIGIVTTKVRPMAQLHLELTGMAPFVDGVFAAETNLHSDKQALILSAIEAFGAKPQDCLMVGDRKYDIDGARDAGVDSVGAMYGYAPAGEFTEHCPTYLIETPLQLLELLPMDE